MKHLRQDPNQFYVCVRERNKWGHGTLMIERIKPESPGIKGAHRALKEAITKYGTGHKAVIEPVEWPAPQKEEE